jgi:predicted TIM-barrel fold metal-dependent hydrolase
MIDFHVHIGRMYREGYPDRPPVTPQQLIDDMNREGIEISVLLPLESPEGGWGYWLTEDAVAARDMYPGRLIAFCCVDPRYPNAAQFIDVCVNRHGCKGFGEHVCSGPFDSEENKVIYARCDEHGLPLDFEINTTLCHDEVGLPRLEACLKEFPNVIWCGHGPAFWTAISADDPRGGYPEEPIKPGGVLDRLLAEHDNLYADISAGSGYNAMTRDPEFVAGFIERHWRKLLFGTDYMWHGHELPIIEWMRDLDVSDEVREAIARGNARRVLRLDQD